MQIYRFRFRDGAPMQGDRSVTANSEKEARDKVIAELASHAPLTPEDLLLLPENEPPPPIEV